MAPKSPMWRDCLNAFWIGGLICVVGQIFTNCYGAWGLEKQDAGTAASMTLVALSALLLLPLVLLIIPATIYSNFATTAELDVVSFVGTVAFIWAGLLIFTGMMVTHDYTLGKNFIISLSTIVGMGFIMFIGILFTTLLGKIISFVSNIIVEINYRM